MKILCIPAVIVLLAGCGMQQPATSFPPTAFEHRVADGRVELYWSCSQPETGILQVDGIAQSPWTQDIRFLELELVGVNAQGRTLGATRAPVRDIVLHTNAPSPFRLLLRTTGAEARMDLYYQYRHRGEPDIGGLGFPGFGGEFRRSFVRDACSAGHRAQG
jgi:hypothetical protein